MNIALDYDGTFTSDPNLWFRFVQDCVHNGHTVYVVTMRYPSECDGTHGRIDRRLAGLRLVCTSRLAKNPHCLKLGIKIDVWIDDNPAAVHLDGTDLWGSASAEGDVIDPHYAKESADG